MAAPAAQDEVVRFLSTGAAYGAPGARVERIETHASIVFLVGARAYKLKKALDLGYLDYSTLARRKAFVEAEIALNRRTAPALYRGAVAVTRAAGGALALGGDGEPLEWLVEMARFDEGALLSRVAEKGALSPALIEALARAVAAFHREAEALGAPFGGAEGLSRALSSNAGELKHFASALGPERVEALITATDAALGTKAALLDKRRREGFVRRCHGDLHLGNVCLWQGEPTLFDAIEFNDDFSVIDILCDFAFLLMDVLHRAAREAASRLFNVYVESTPLAEAEALLEGLAALPLFLSYRAAVRAHVIARAAEGAEAKLEEARTYAADALAHLSPPRPALIAIGGLSGTGKSTLARAIAPHLGARYGALVLRSDVTRKRLHGVSPTARLPESAYAREAGTAVYEALYRWAARALGAGQSVILDAVFARPDERARAEALAQQAGVPFAGFWLEAEPSVLRARLAARRGDASDADAAVLEKQLTYDLGAIAWARLDARKTVDALASELRPRLP